MLKRYRALLACVTVIVIIVACRKGKLETKPFIEIKSYNAKSLPDDQDFLINIKFTDKEGDLGNGQLVYYRDRLNTLPPINTLADSAQIQIPDFPKEKQGEFQLRIEARFLNSRPGKDSINPDLNNDTVRFKIIVKDLAGNVSDTIATDPLVQLEAR